MKKNIKFIIFTITVLLSIPLILYFVSFHGSLSKKTDEWICFSSVLSASIGTTISAITLLILLIDRKTSENERKTNQYIDYLFHQNQAITKNYVANGYVEIPIEQKFGEINSYIEQEYCTIVIFNYLNEIGLSNCPKEIQDYILFGYSVLRRKHKNISAKSFDEELSDEVKLKAIRYAPTTNYTEISNLYIDGIKHISLSKIRDNIEIIKLLRIKSDYSILNNCFKLKNIKEKYPYSISAFINTYRYALLHLLDYKPGLSLYFSQLSLEQKIFIAFDIVSMDNNSIYKTLKKDKALLLELLSDEVLEKSKLLAILYNLDS